MTRRLITVAVGALALAVGVALGAGPLGEAARPTADALGVPGTSSAGASDTGSDAAGEAFATAVAPRLYRAGLTGHPVALLVMPGVPSSTVSELQHEVRRAGGTTTGVFAGTRSLLDPGQISLVDTLGSQLVTQLGVRGGGAGAIDPRASTYARMGRLVRLATTTVRSSTAPASAATSTIRRSLQAADLVTVPGGPSTAPPLAPLLLVVLGPDLAHGDQPVLTALLQGLRSGPGARRVVVSGPRGGSAPVPGVEDTMGRVTAVLGLVDAVK